MQDDEYRAAIARAEKLNQDIDDIIRDWNHLRHDILGKIGLADNSGPYANQYSRHLNITGLFKKRN